MDLPPNIIKHKSLADNTLICNHDFCLHTTVALLIWQWEKSATQNTTGSAQSTCLY